MSDVTLVSVNPRSDEHLSILYKLLTERDETINISHKELPTINEHIKYVRSKPYKAWYIILNGNMFDEGTEAVGSVYLTHRNEIGMFIFKGMSGKGYASAALDTLLDNYPNGDILSNVNPKNEASMAWLKKYGFELLQHTYILRRS